MSEIKILVDTNSYFRLAQSINPLLGQFNCGDDHYFLYIIPELEREYVLNPRLKNKFSWVAQAEYVKNRNMWILKPQKKKAAIEKTYEFVFAFAKNAYPGVSKTDARYIAYGIVMGVPIVTDDSDMRALAEEYSVETWKTLEMIKQMLDCGHIDKADVKSIAGYMKYSLDTPKSFSGDYRRLFGEHPPD